MRYLTGIICMLLGVLFFSCSSPSGLSDSDGGGTKTGNPAVVTATVLDQSGEPILNARISARSAGYLCTPDDSTVSKSDRYHTTTDTHGNFVINAVDTGNFYIEANDNMASAVLFRCHISNSDSAINLGTGTLAPYSIIKGTINVPTPFQTTVQIYGMERYSIVDSLGNFFFSDLPAGTYSIRLSGNSSIVSHSHYDSVTIGKATSTILPYVGWIYSKKIFFNTTSGGADIQSPVYNFPLLVRLTSANFDFSQTLENGQDLRFRKSDGTAVPYEIETWDATAKTASIWVKIDTLAGNSNTQYIVMHWGKSSEVSLSNALEVFNAQNGFLGVWHLNNTPTNAAASVQNGVLYGATNVDGLIGTAEYFDGSDYIEIPGLLNKPQTVTLSAWTNLENADTMGAEVISIGDGVILRLDDSLVADSASFLGTQGAFCFDSVATKGTRHKETYSKQFLANKGWHYVTYVHNDALKTQSLYIDGSFIVSTNDTLPIIYDGIGTNTFIGKHGDSSAVYDFTGTIDEVRVCGAARTAEWIKLCYMNQKSADALIRFDNSD